MGSKTSKKSVIEQIEFARTMVFSGGRRVVRVNRKDGVLGIDMDGVTVAFPNGLGEKYFIPFTQVVNVRMVDVDE